MTKPCSLMRMCSAMERSAASAPCSVIAVHISWRSWSDFTLRPGLVTETTLEMAMRLSSPSLACVLLVPKASARSCSRSLVPGGIRPVRMPERMESYAASPNHSVGPNRTQSRCSLLCFILRGIWARPPVIHWRRCVVEGGVLDNHILHGIHNGNLSCQGGLYEVGPIFGTGQGLD